MMSRILTASLLVLALACTNRQANPPATQAAAQAGPQPAQGKNFLDKQLLVPVAPEEVGFSPARLARIDSGMLRYVQAGQLPGMVGLVARRGKIVYHKAFGQANLAKGQTMQPNSIFRIMSMTKAITSVGVMMLYEEGKLRLDDPVAKYIPEFGKPLVLKQLILTKRDTSFRAVPAKKEVTVRHLLTHTAGIAYGHPLYKKAGIPDFHSLRGLTLAQTMPKLAALPRLHEPGEQFTYGLNTDMLGYLIERVSGQSLAEFFHRRIFEPLGMDDTFFYVPDNKASRLVELYEQSGDSLRAHTNRPFADYPVQGAKTYYSGGAGLSSTAPDYAKFLQMLLNGGRYNGNQLLSRRTIELMTTNQVGPLEVWDRKNKFGLGFEITDSGAWHLHPLSLGSYEWGGMYNTHFWVDRKEELVGVLMTQVWPTNHWGVGEQFKVLVYQALVD
jgi:CubicO group peptidase (beta-lactamase class C family)